MYWWQEQEINNALRRVAISGFIVGFILGAVFVAIAFTVGILL